VALFFADVAFYLRWDLAHLFIAIFLFLLVVMLLKLAAFCILTGLSTAPPHRAAPFASMRATRPVEVLGLVILAIAVVAQFFVEIYIAPHL
jgi:hypothetical protein